MSIDAGLFRAVLGRFASGVTILTTVGDDGGDLGMTVSAFCSVSLEPPFVLASIAESAELHPVLARAPHFGVSILTQHQEALSRRFAEEDVDRFEGVGLMRGSTGVALISGALAHAECRIVARHAAGDHMLLVAEVEDAATFDGRPLLYYRGGYAGLER